MVLIVFLSKSRRANLFLAALDSPEPDPDLAEWAGVSSARRSRLGIQEPRVNTKHFECSLPFNQGAGCLHWAGSLCQQARTKKILFSAHRRRHHHRLWHHQFFQPKCEKWSIHVHYMSCCISKFLFFSTSSLTKRHCPLSWSVVALNLQEDQQGSWHYHSQRYQCRSPCQRPSPVLRVLREKAVMQLQQANAKLISYSYCL